MSSSSPQRRKRTLVILVLSAALGILLLRPVRAVWPIRQQNEVLIRAKSPTIGAASMLAPSQGVGGVATTTAGTVHMRALTFAVGPGGIRLADAVVVLGRAKAPPRSVAANRIEFEAWDGRREVVYAGSVEHPLHRVFEYEDPQQPGTLRQIPHEEPRGAFQLRLPANISATRIVFTEVRSIGGREVRKILAEEELQ